MNQILGDIVFSQSNNKLDIYYKSSQNEIALINVRLNPFWPTTIIQQRCK